MYATDDCLHLRLGQWYLQYHFKEWLKCQISCRCWSSGLFTQRFRTHYTPQLHRRSPHALSLPIRKQGWGKVGEGKWERLGQPTQLSLSVACGTQAVNTTHAAQQVLRTLDGGQNLVYGRTSFDAWSVRHTAGNVKQNWAFVRQLWNPRFCLGNPISRKEKMECDLEWK